MVTCRLLIRNAHVGVSSLVYLCVSQRKPIQRDIATVPLAFIVSIYYYVIRQELPREIEKDYLLDCLLALLRLHVWSCQRKKDEDDSGPPGREVSSRPPVLGEPGCQRNRLWQATRQSTFPNPRGFPASKSLRGARSGKRVRESNPWTRTSVSFQFGFPFILAAARFWFLVFSLAFTSVRLFCHWYSCMYYYRNSTLKNVLAILRGGR